MCLYDCVWSFFGCIQRTASDPLFNLSDILVAAYFVPPLPSHCLQPRLCWIADTGSQQGCVWFQFFQAYLCQHFFDHGHHSLPRSESKPGCSILSPMHGQSVWKGLIAQHKTVTAVCCITGETCWMQEKKKSAATRRKWNWFLFNSLYRLKRLFFVPCGISAPKISNNLSQVLIRCSTDRKFLFPNFLFLPLFTCKR